MRHVQAVLAGLVGIAAAACQHAVAPPASSSARSDLSEIDRKQSEIVQSGDIAALEALLHPAYAVHLPDGRIIDLQQTLTLARTGQLAREKHRRTQERVIINGSTGAVMGFDRLDSPPPLATRGERTRRYTNVYVRDSGRWRLIARHFHFLP